MALKHFSHLISFLWLMEPLAATLAKPGCRDSCGNVNIPYPFGIGTGCFIDEWFEVVCHGNRSYLNKYYGHEFQVEVLYVSLGRVSLERYRSITINSNNSNISVCEDKSIWPAGNLSGSPYFYDLNKVILVGCGTVTLLEDARTLAACTSTCGQPSITHGCDGNNCCEISIPSTAQDFYLNFSYSEVTRTNSCASIIFGNDIGASYSYPSEIDRNSFPVQLRWSIPELMVPGLQNNPNCYKDPDYGEYRCSCGGYRRGNPYLPNGCEGHFNISMARKPFSTSFSTSRRKLILLAVGGTSFGILILGTVGFISYKIISKKRERKLREKFFKKNGGLLLQQQLSIDENMVDKVKFFTSNELDKATDNFNQNRVLGHGGQGTVYKGMLVDGKIVAIKKSKLANENQVEQFINEVAVLSQINHRNVVKLLGCCLETEVPLLVYEFIPNGTLYELIHNENDDALMSWDMRLRIATEVSGALAYLHSATSVPIYHRDVKSSNILLDEKHKAKVSDFGISRHVTIEQTHLTTMVKGTLGYLDPEYFQSNQFTDKSDVYSFGVVLIELLTRQKPISSTRSTVESGLSLATRFLISMEENHLNTILDAQILDTTNDKQVKAVAILAHRCLSLDGRKRPTMKEVALELESIKMSHPPSIVQKNLQGNKDTENELVLFSDGISSSTIANDTIASSSDVYPLLSDTF